MSRHAQSAADRWVQRAILVVAGLLALTVLGLGGVYARERFLQASTTRADRQLEEAKFVVTNDPESLTARIQLANAYMGKEMYRESLEQFGEALKRDENNRELLMSAGLAAMRGKQDDQAIEYFEKVVDLSKDYEFASSDRRLNAVYYELGRLYLNKGQPDKAVENLTEALKIQRTDADALLLMGQALAAQGQSDKAIDMFRYATAYVPNFTEAYQGMAAVAEKKGDAAKAAYARAMIAFSTGKYDEAIKGLEAVVPRLTDFADAPFGLGMAYEMKGEKARAVEFYQKAVDINPQHGIAKSNVERLSR